MTDPGFKSLRDAPGYAGLHPEGTAGGPASSPSLWRGDKMLRIAGRMLPISRMLHGTDHRMTLEPLLDLSGDGDGYSVIGPNPELRLRSDRAIAPCGWVAVSYRWHSGGDRPGRLLLLADTGAARAEMHLLPARDTTGMPVLLRLPARVRGLRLQPRGASGFGLEALHIHELSAAQILREQLRPYGTVVLREPGMAWHFFRRGLEVLFHHGVHELRAALTMRVAPRPEDLYREWVRRYDSPGEHEGSLVRQQVARLRTRPRFTCVVLMAGHGAPALAPAIGTLRGQWYPDWELLLVMTPQVPEAAAAAMRRLRDGDARVRFVETSASACRPEALNQAVALATGTFCGVLASDAHLAPYALYVLAAECNAHPDAAMLYGDEDHMDSDGRRHTPVFKPDWNPDLLCSQPFVGQPTFYATSVLRRLGGWRTGLDGLEDWDLALRAGTVLPEAQIRHVPHVLHHGRAAPEPLVPCPQVSAEPARRVLGDHLERLGAAVELTDTEYGAVRIRYGIGAPAPLVSIIVPTRNGQHLLERCVAGLRRTDYPNWELVIVDNQSDDPETTAYLHALGTEPNVGVLRFDQPFNFSVANNVAATHARGSILALLNNDVEVITPNWLAEMVGHALRPEVGAVGAKLYYPDGRLQHAGIILGLGKLAGHAYRGLIEPEPVPGARTCWVQNVSAVTAACLVIRTELYQAVGGLDEELPIAYNDVDLCLRLRQRGYRIVWTPHAQLCHRESATRGLDHSVQKVRRLRREQALMLARWGAVFNWDPAYNPNLTLSAPGFAPAFPPRVRRPWAPARQPIA